MKIISKVLLMVILSFTTFSINTNAGFFEDLFEESQPKVHIDCGEQDCNINTGTELVKNSVTGIETERTLSEYIQDVVVYLLGFLSIIAVLYIIYAGFRILVGAGDEDNLKKQKNTILYVVIGISIIWLAYSIVKLIIDILNSSSV